MAHLFKCIHTYNSSCILKLFNLKFLDDFMYKLQVLVILLLLTISSVYSSAVLIVYVTIKVIVGLLYKHTVPFKTQNV